MLKYNPGPQINFLGVPGRDLTDEEVAAIDPDILKQMLESKVYFHESDTPSPAPPPPPDAPFYDHPLNLDGSPHTEQATVESQPTQAPEDQGSFSATHEEAV